MPTTNEQDEGFPSFPTLESLASQSILKQRIDNMSRAELIEVALNLNREFSETYHNLRSTLDGLGYDVEIVMRNIDERFERITYIDPKDIIAKIHLKSVDSEIFADVKRDLDI